MAEPDWLKTRKTLEKNGLLADTSGIPLTVKFDSIGELIDRFRKAKSAGNNSIFYRGQSKDWSTTTSRLSRQLEIIKSSESKRQIEIDLIKFFRDRANELSIKIPDEDQLLLGIMQHYGAPTRFLDWSSNPFVALYFAVQEIDYCIEDGILWELNSRLLRNEFNYHSKEDENILDVFDLGGSETDNFYLFDEVISKNIRLPLPFYIAYGTPRIKNQEGCFTCDGSLGFCIEDLTNRNNWDRTLFDLNKVSKSGRWVIPTGQSLDLAYPQDLVRKVIIKSAFKMELKEWLEKELSISNSFLFPDINDPQELGLREIGIQACEFLKGRINLFMPARGEV